VSKGFLRAVALVSASAVAPEHGHSKLDNGDKQDPDDAGEAVPDYGGASQLIENIIQLLVLRILKLTQNLKEQDNRA
jgi:hypothetical protein